MALMKSFEAALKSVRRCTTSETLEWWESTLQLSVHHQDVHNTH